MSTIAWMFPGQGSQAVGMGRELFEHPAGRAVFEEADEALEVRLRTLCFEGPESELTLTANTQPAILTVSIAALRVLQAERDDLEPIACLGHSLGEFSALVAAGALRFSDAVRLVRLRGQAMQEAVPQGTGAMAAILGVPEGELDVLCGEAAQGQVVSPANENGGGQIVVAGDAAAVERLVASVKSRKGRAIPLKVSAPFHCALMQPAADRLAEALEGVDVSAPRVPIVTNVEAEPNTDASRIKDLLVRQVTHRVRWEASVRTLVRMGATAAIELGHGSVLSGLAKRIDKELRVVSVGSPADVSVLDLEAR
jgi:[acyl-carrier-protein] S-malonyltransferase